MERTAQRLGPWLFWAMAAFHLWPVFASKWFVTLDGPCHVYNARVILDLVLGRGSMGSFFELNPFPEPNWLGHAIMAALMTVLPAYAAEKLIFILIIGGTAWAFRRLTHTLSPDRPWLSWLVMPFLLTYTLRMGFINFCLGISLMLLALDAWERRLQQNTTKAPWGTAVLLLLLYFAHLTTCLATIALLVLRTIAHVRSSGRDRRAFTELIAVIALPAVLAAAFMLTHSTSEEAAKRLPLNELAQWLIEGRAWNTLVYEDEVPYTRIIALALLALMIVALIAWWREGRWKHGHTWSLIAAWGSLAAFFVLPDRLASGGILSPRLLLFAMLLFAVALLAFRVNKWVAIGGIVIIVAADGLHTVQQKATAESLGNELNELMAVAPAVPPNAVLLPLNYGTNWMHSNFSEYVGAQSGCVVLDNIGAATPHFPVRWIDGRSPYEATGNFNTSNAPCVRMDGYQANGKPLVDHVLTWKLRDELTDSCTANVRAQLAAHFELIASSPLGDARLYRRK